MTCFLFVLNSTEIFISNIALHVGAYVPLTTEGNILVNGVLASCYASVDHELAHIGMTGMQWFPQIANWIFGKEDTGSQISVSGIVKLLGKLIFPDGLFGASDF